MNFVKHLCYNKSMKKNILTFLLGVAILGSQGIGALAASIEVDWLHIFESVRENKDDGYVKIFTTLPADFDPTKSSGGIKVSFVDPETNETITPINWTWGVGAFQKAGQRFITSVPTAGTPFAIFFPPKEKQPWTFTWNSNLVDLPITAGLKKGEYTFDIELTVTTPRDAETMKASITVIKKLDQWKMKLKKD